MSKPTKTLHLLNKPPGHSRFQACLSAIGDHDQLVLMENATLAIAEQQSALPSGWLALADDAQARALTVPEIRHKLISFPELATLSEQHIRIISW